MYTALASAALILAQLTTAAPAPSPAAAPGKIVIPAGTTITVHLVKMLSSHDEQTGEPFAFDAVTGANVGGIAVVAQCAVGAGVVALAGKHGINGHEGDLHLRFDSLQGIDGTTIALKQDEQTFEGKNQKAAAFFMSRWINGNDVELHTDKDLIVITAADVTIDPSKSLAAPVCPTPAPTPTPVP